MDDVYFIKLELRDGGGRLISDNFYWNGFIRGRLDALNEMKQVALSMKAKGIQETKTVKVDFAVADLNGEKPLLMVEGWNIKPGEIKMG